MSTSLDYLALHFSKDCDPHQGWWVVFWSVVAITALSVQFGWLALAAAIGSLIGLAIHFMASRAARAIRRTTNASTVGYSRDQAESRAVGAALRAFATRSLHFHEQRAFGAAVAVFVGLGVAHVSLSTRLFPYPVLSRA